MTDTPITKKVRLKDGYGLPIIADGSIRYTIETEAGEDVMTLAIFARGDTAEGQREHFAAERVRIAAYVDLINAGIETQALRAKLAQMPKLTNGQEG